MIRAAADGRKLIELFVIDENGRLKVFTPHSEMHPCEGWTLISLVSNHEGSSQKIP